MDLSLFLEGGWVSRKDHLVTLLRCHYWLGGVGVQGKSDNVTLYHVFFLTASLSRSFVDVHQSDLVTTLQKLAKG